MLHPANYVCYKRCVSYWSIRLARASSGYLCLLQPLCFLLEYRASTCFIQLFMFAATAITSPSMISPVSPPIFSEVSSLLLSGPVPFLSSGLHVKACGSMFSSSEIYELRTCVSLAENYTINKTQELHLIDLCVPPKTVFTCRLFSVLI